MKALDTIKYPTLSNLERTDEERQRDDSNQQRVNANFKRIADAVNELAEGKATTEYVMEQVKNSLDLRIESQTFTNTVTNVIVDNSFLVTETMHVKSIFIANPANVLGNITWTTSNGSLKISGSFTNTGTKIIFFVSEVRN